MSVARPRPRAAGPAEPTAATGSLDESCHSGPLRLRGRSGQASVELVALLPLVATIGFGGFQVLAAGAAEEVAGSAAEAGAVALLQDGDASAAARRALPHWARSRSTVRVGGRRITVRVEPRGLGALTSRLVATATADAGPEPPQ